MKKFLTVLSLFAVLQAHSQSTTLVISQVYGGGGNTGAPFNADFVVLHNISNTSQSLSGLSFQYASATATGNWTGVFALPAATIPAGGYYLIQVSGTGATGSALPTPDAVVAPAIAMSATAGRVALVNGTTALNACPTANVIDLVGFGTTAICFEGTGPTGAPSNTTAVIRNNNGCTDTDNNANDFSVGAPNPQNSASTPVDCSSAAPIITVTTLADFGSVCTGTTAGPNSFTITGSNLTTANVTVGPLSGFTFATTAGGTYSASLSLTQPGGSYNQEIFVQFSPTAVQSYNGNIPVAGGGVSTPVNVAASGSGIGASAPTVTAAAATSVTANSATLPGSITSTGCGTISAYGMEYSTTQGFANGTGTQVAGSNLSGANFSVNISGLSSNTTYYYKAYATNGTGTGYSAEQSFTTGSGTAVTGIVLSQVFGGGGGSTGTYKNDYVELHNNTNGTLSLTGLSLQYGSATGNFGSSSTNIYAFPAGASIPAGGYVLVQLGPVGSAGLDLPVTPDFVTTNLSMSGASGKVALANQTTALGCGATATPCTLPNSLIIDLVSYGASNNGEGGTTVNNGVALTSTQGAVRKDNGCQDTDNNNADFDVITAPVPRNSASTPFVCGAAPPPSLGISSSLAAFGNVCVNTTAGPNSFAITGTNLTAADVTVAALSGFTYATAAGGPYTSTLSIPQPGGSFSQQVFVQFTPTAVQSYNGNIAVSGGGVTTAVNAAASGAGVDPVPVVVTGTPATGITTTTATAPGSISNPGCSAITAYGIEYSTTQGFANGTGTQVPANNLNAGNFSAALSGLSNSTTYYYKAFATNAVGTGYGAEQSFTTLTPNPTLTATALTAFGNVCVNTTAGPNSFTISGSNLTAANVTVGPLAGFTFSTTSGGTYTASLSLTQSGGTYSQQIFVRFTPTAVQSFSGNIPVGGGGAPTINVAAAGAGVNTQATVTTGAASAVTFNSATAAGTIGATGCSSVTAYGIEYSTTNNFTPGTGTQVASSNLAAGAFSSALSGLAASTLYYYRAYATNAGGTAYGAQLSFTTTAVPISLTATALTAFGSVCVNTTAGPNSFTINGAFLTNANINVGPLAGYTFSTTSGGTYTASLSLTQPGGTYTQQIFVRFTPTAVQSFNGNIPVNGGGFSTTVNVAASGDGVNTTPTVQTGAASSLTPQSAVTAGSISANGCSPVSEYGIEYSGISGFGNGSGTRVAAANLAGGNFSVFLGGLVQGATYYYKAYATNAGGTAYGAQQSFTLPVIRDGFTLFPSPVVRGTETRITRTSTTPGSYSLQFFNMGGQLVYQRNMNIQAGFINQAFTLPGSMAPGIYRVLLVKEEKIVDSRSVQVF